MLKKIISFLKNINSSKNEFFGEVYFHEEFFRQIELFPAENSKYFQIENKQIEDFREIHSDENGLSNAIYTIEGSEIVEISEKKILVTEVETILLNYGLNKIESVFSGYIPNNYKCENIIVFKYENSEIFIEFENEFIKHIYLNQFRFQEKEEIKIRLQEILHEIGIKFNLILNDWNLTEMINLKEKKDIEKYLNE